MLTRQLNYNLEDLGIEKVERFSMESLDSAIERTQLAFDKLYEPSMEGLVSKFFDKVICRAFVSFLEDCKVILSSLYVEIVSFL